MGLGGTERARTASRLQWTLKSSEDSADSEGMKDPVSRGTMATMALPIRELERSVCVSAEHARAETERVVQYSEATRADVATACKVMFRAFGLKWLLASLVRNQDKLISRYREYDFNRCTPEQLADVADSLESILTRERDLLTKANALGAEVRVWWGDSLWQLTEQVECLESIADSLRVACNDEATALLAIAAEQFAVA